MATIIQRALSNSAEAGNGFDLSDEEKTQLLAEIDKISKDVS
jgi:hypothetical protein